MLNLEDVTIQSRFDALGNCNPDCGPAVGLGSCGPDDSNSNYDPDFGD